MPRMVQFAHAVLRNALSNAVREELVSRNVAKMVKTSSPDYTVGAGLDPLAARTLLAQIGDDRASRRVIPLPDVVVQALHRHRRRQDGNGRWPATAGRTAGSCSPRGRAGRCRPAH